MIDLKNAYISHISLQKVGNKLRDELNIFATSTLELDERKEEELTPYLLNPFKKQLDKHRFTHYTEQLEFNVLYTLSNDVFQEKLDFLAYAHQVLQHLYERSDHPQIKSGEVFVVQFEDVLYESINTSAIGIYKLENKRKFLRFDESETIDYSIFKGYKLEGVDKACLILNVDKEDGFRVFSVDDNHFESEYWKKGFLEIDYIKDHAYYTKNYIQLLNEFSNEVVLEKTDKKNQAEFISNGIQLFTQNEIISDELIHERLLTHYNVEEEFSAFKNNYMQESKIELSPSFEVSIHALNQQKRKIKSEIRLDTDIQIKLNINKPEASEDYLERGFDEEKKMFYYKIYFNTELL